MEKKDFDLLIVGEGEKPMLALLNVLADGKPLEEVPGLWWRKDGVIYSTPKTTLLPAGEMPPADWSLHDEEALNNLFYLWGILPVMGSRGCPANCSFCSITNIQKMYEGECFLRFRDPISVVDEIHGHYEKYKDKGMRIVFFYDLNFLLDPQWLERFVTEYKRRGLNRKLKWSAYTRADHVTKEVVALLKDSGCINLRIGIEAANPRMRNEIYRKDVSQEQLYFALKEISRMDISITGYFIAGGPGERPEWLLESLDLAWRYGIENPVFFLYKPLAGTDILDMAESLGSFVLADTMKEAWDYLHGVNMKHLNIEGWQLEAFVALSQLVFGVPIITHQLLREGPMYFVRLAQYVKSALRLGFSPYMATCYYVFYGFDHMKNPVIFPAHPTPSFFWHLMIGCTKLWLKTPSSNKERAAYAPQR